MAEAVVRLKPVSRSPATIQYLKPRPTATGRPLYQRRFYPNQEALESLTQPWLAATDPLMPPYPYGKNYHFEEANHGLYGGASIQSGNKISDGRNKGKTLRKWYPNVRVERLKSEALNVELSIPTVARVKRTIEKCGGLDEYLLGEKPARLKELGLLGWKLRWLVLKSDAMKKKHSKQRAESGVPESIDATTTFADAWADPEIRAKLISKMQVGWEQLKEKEQKSHNHLKKASDEIRVKSVKSLQLYSPETLTLPEYVEDSAVEVPQVETGYGLIVMPGSARDVSSSVLPVPNLKLVNKNPSKRHEEYKGGANSAVADDGQRKGPVRRSTQNQDRGQTEEKSLVK